MAPRTRNNTSHAVRAQSQSQTPSRQTRQQSADETASPALTISSSNAVTTSTGTATDLALKVAKRIKELPSLAPALIRDFLHELKRYGATANEHLSLRVSETLTDRGVDIADNTAVVTYLQQLFDEQEEERKENPLLAIAEGVPRWNRKEKPHTELESFFDKVRAALRGANPSRKVLLKAIKAVYDKIPDKHRPPRHYLYTEKIDTIESLYDNVKQRITLDKGKEMDEAADDGADEEEDEEERKPKKRGKGFAALELEQVIAAVATTVGQAIKQSIPTTTPTTQPPAAHQPPPQPQQATLATTRPPPEHQHQHQHQHPSDNTPFDEFQARRESGACFQCGQQGHIARNCPQFPCRGCGENGHVVRDCRAPSSYFNVGRGRRGGFSSFRGRGRGRGHSFGRGRGGYAGRGRGGGWHGGYEGYMNEQSGQGYPSTGSGAPNDQQALQLAAILHQQQQSQLLQQSQILQKMNEFQAQHQPTPPTQQPPQQNQLALTNGSQSNNTHTVARISSDQDNDYTPTKAPPHYLQFRAFSVEIDQSAPTGEDSNAMELKEGDMFVIQPHNLHEPTALDYYCLMVSGVECAKSEWGTDDTDDEQEQQLNKEMDLDEETPARMLREYTIASLEYMMNGMTTTTQVFGVKLWLAVPATGAYTRVQGFLDSGAQVSVLNKLKHGVYLVAEYPLEAPTRLRMMNGTTIPVTKRGLAAVKLTRGKEERDLQLVEVMVIEEATWEDLVIGKPTLARMGWLPEQAAFGLGPQTTNTNDDNSS